MSAKNTEDYKAVLNCTFDKINSKPCRVVLDFEAAVWSALQKVSPDPILSGCSFHWGH